MDQLIAKILRRWSRFWMRFAGLSRTGRLAARLAAWFTPPYKARSYLAWLSPRGFVSPKATIYHPHLRLGSNVFIGDDVIIFRSEDGGPVEIGDAVVLWADLLIETGAGGRVTVGERSRLHRGCQLISFKEPIQIGRDVGISQNCAFYSYNHGFTAGRAYAELESRGPIIVGDHAWLGVGVIVLDGVRIGRGAVIGAGAVVTRDIPDGAIAVGVPARVVKRRDEIPRSAAVPSA